MEGSPIGAGQKERQEEEEETPDYPQVRRSLQGQHTPHLSLGAREGGIESNGGSDTPVPWGTHHWRNEGRAEEKWGIDGIETHLTPDL